ncbi:hypothetical protein [Candidatus Ichthyocystis hellenicum]|uniref:hypothetical protein n=1 Tax=Candidatus Ichthyocystis hellenicum TaxID=1561003 RepID=UPI0011122843|nr:hypothetical protein [Candidatus Ichthyocystis hellenicum]
MISFYLVRLCGRRQKVVDSYCFFTFFDLRLHIYPIMMDRVTIKNIPTVTKNAATRSLTGTTSSSDSVIVTFVKDGLHNSSIPDFIDELCKLSTVLLLNDVELYCMAKLITTTSIMLRCHWQ